MLARAALCVTLSKPSRISRKAHPTTKTSHKPLATLKGIIGGSKIDWKEKLAWAGAAVARAGRPLKARPTQTGASRVGLAPSAAAEPVSAAAAVLAAAAWAAGASANAATSG